MERRASRPSCKLFRKILRRRSLDPRWRRLFRFRSLAPRNQPVQVIPVRPIRAEVLFIEQSLGAAPQADLVRIALASHRPAHPAMPAPPKRDHGHSRQASRHHPQRPQPPVFPRFFAPLRAFCHHSSQGTHDLQHRPDCSVGQTQRVVPGFFLFFAFFTRPHPKVQSALYHRTLRYMPEEHYPWTSGSCILFARGTKNSNAAHHYPARIECDEIQLRVIVTA